MAALVLTSQRHCAIILFLLTIAMMLPRSCCLCPARLTAGDNSLTLLENCNVGTTIDITGTDNISIRVANSVINSVTFVARQLSNAVFTFSSTTIRGGVLNSTAVLRVANLSMSFVQCNIELRGPSSLVRFDSIVQGVSNLTIVFDRSDILIQPYEVASPRLVVIKLERDSYSTVSYVTFAMMRCNVTMSFPSQPFQLDADGFATDQVDASLFQLDGNIDLQNDTPPRVVVGFMSVVLTNSIVTMSAQRNNRPVALDDVLVHNSIITVTNVIARLSSLGTLSYDVNGRDSFLVGLHNSIASDTMIRMTSCMVSVVSAACDTSTTRIASRCRGTQGSFLVLRTQYNVSVVIKNSTLKVVVSEGVVSTYRGEIIAFAVQVLENESRLCTFDVSDSAVYLTIIPDLCFTNRTVRLGEKGNGTTTITLSGGALSISTAVVALILPSTDTVINVKSSQVFANFSDWKNCKAESFAAILTTPIFGKAIITAFAMQASSVSIVILLSEKPLIEAALGAVFVGPPWLLPLIRLEDASTTSSATQALRMSIHVASSFLSVDEVRAPLYRTQWSEIRAVVTLLGADVMHCTVAVNLAQNATPFGALFRVNMSDSTFHGSQGVPSASDSLVPNTPALGSLALFAVMNSTTADSTVSFTNLWRPYVFPGGYRGTDNLPNVTGLITLEATSLASTRWIVESLTVREAPSWLKLVVLDAVDFGNATSANNTFLMSCPQWNSHSMFDTLQLAQSTILNVPFDALPRFDLRSCVLSGTSSVLSDATRQAGGACAVLSFVATVSGDASAATDLQLFGIMGMTMCASSGLRHASGPMVYLVSPFADLGSAWSAGGNVLVSVCFACVHLCAVRVVMWRRHLRRWVDGAAVVQFPGVSYSVCVLLVSGAVRFGLQLLADAAVGTGGGSSGGAVVLGVVSVAWAVLVPCAAAVCVWRRGGERVFRAYRVSVWRRRFGWPAVLAFPLGVWEPEAERRRVGRLVSSMRGGDELLGPYGVWVTVAASFVSVFRPSGNAGCCAQWAVLGALFGGVAVALVIRCPTRAPLSSYVSGMSYTLLCVLAIVNSLWAAGVVSAVTVELGTNVLSLALLVVAFVRGAQFLVVQVLERRVARQRSKTLTSVGISYNDKGRVVPEVALEALVRWICLNPHPQP